MKRIYSKLLTLILISIAGFLSLFTKNANALYLTNENIGDIGYTPPQIAIIELIKTFLIVPVLVLSVLLVFPYIKIKSINKNKARQILACGIFGLLFSLISYINIVIIADNYRFFKNEFGKDISNFIISNNYKYIAIFIDSALFFFFLYFLIKIIISYFMRRTNDAKKE